MKIELVNPFPVFELKVLGVGASLEYHRTGENMPDLVNLNLSILVWQWNKTWQRA